MKLKAEFKKNCIGCELCVLEAQRQLGKIGLEGAPVRIFKEFKNGKMEFEIDIDPSINNLSIKKIKDICPALVFSLVEESDELTS